MSLKLKSIIPCILGVLICLGVGVIAGMATESQVATWYPTLHQPSFTPPAYVFAPVWTFLYVLMGIAVGLVYPVEHRLKKIALICFFVQLFFNGLWSFIFFSWHQVSLALTDLGLIWLLLLVTIALFYRVRPMAAYLLIPYFLWSSFAFLINAMLVVLN
jgi:tryptophan-rich sensory protein